MGELSEPQWAVVSERGREATGLDYNEARDLMRRLTEQKIQGAAIVTADAARRFTHTTPALNQSDSSSTAQRKA